jgi:hypothetical protein
MPNGRVLVVQGRQHRRERLCNSSKGFGACGAAAALPLEHRCTDEEGVRPRVLARALRCRRG